MQRALGRAADEVSAERFSPTFFKEWVALRATPTLKKVVRNL